MKTKIFIRLSLVTLCFGFRAIQPANEKKPKIYIDNFKTEVKDGQLINCRKIKDMGVIVYFTEQMTKYDVFKVEVHRTGENEDALVAFKNFIPNSKEFQKKYIGKESVKLKLFDPTDTFTSDFETNSLLFTPDTPIDNVICIIHELKHCNFYIIVKGYNKTGEKNRFGEEAYTEGKEESPKSIIFRNFEKPH